MPTVKNNIISPPPHNPRETTIQEKPISAKGF
jgi:hypothetical protein